MRFYFHLYKSSIYLECLCWMEFVPKCNSPGREDGMGQCWIRMSWLEKFAKINYLWGGDLYLAPRSNFWKKPKIKILVEFLNIFQKIHFSKNRTLSVFDPYDTQTSNKTSWKSYELFWEFLVLLNFSKRIKLEICSKITWCVWCSHSRLGFNEIKDLLKIEVFEILIRKFFSRLGKSIWLVSVKTIWQ